MAGSEAMTLLGMGAALGGLTEVIVTGAVPAPAVPVGAALVAGAVPGATEGAPADMT